MPCPPRDGRVRDRRRAGPPLVADQDLVAEIEAEPAVPAPAHEGVDAAAFGELDEHRLAEARLEVALHHRPARGDVEHRHRIRRAAEPDDRLLDQVLMARLGAAFGPALPAYLPRLNGHVRTSFSPRRQEWQHKLSKFLAAETS